MSKNYFLIRKMAFCALLTSICYIVTAFLPFPYASSSGYFNLGDIFIILSSIILGPMYGMFAGIVAGTMADLTAGFGAYIPFTLVAKALLALCSGFGFILFKRKKYFSIIGMIIGEILAALTYFIAGIIMYGIETAAINIGFDLLQGFVSFELAYMLFLYCYKIFNKYFDLENKNERNVTEVTN